MIYTWRDRCSGKDVEVTRSMKDYTNPPTQNECLAAGMSEEEFKKAMFVKLVTGGAFSVGFGPIGKGSKGNW